MTTRAHAAVLATYEIRVVGVLGPLLLSMLPHVAAVRVPRRTTVVTAVGDDDQLDVGEMIRPLVEAGLEVVSVRRDREVNSTCPAAFPA